ncbi:hypothetical protein QCN29_30290 [Streptomyces sp. HNM0663]|uniref:Uncharacterized protein n=1 Tax=Streptomyces chengmaiensis TaxID=3040919 RepID=A0ABT6HWA5_9ACTN|nr:hypothetical protein [Streptomyces chengmaiensis]MDH2392991.1 hypothetical protein [Streptomyces chengmaiensis]
MTIPRSRHVGPRPDWTAADYDSFEVLVALGARRPAARVTRARSPRSARRAVRAAVRSTCSGLALWWPVHRRTHRRPAGS